MSSWLPRNININRGNRNANRNNNQQQLVPMQRQQLFAPNRRANMIQQPRMNVYQDEYDDQYDTYDDSYDNNTYDDSYDIPEYYAEHQRATTSFNPFRRQQRPDQQYYDTLMTQMDAPTNVRLTNPLDGYNVLANPDPRTRRYFEHFPDISTKGDTAAVAANKAVAKLEAVRPRIDLAKDASVAQRTTCLICQEPITRNRSSHGDPFEWKLCLRHLPSLYFGGELSPLDGYSNSVRNIYAYLLKDHAFNVNQKNTNIRRKNQRLKDYTRQERTAVKRANRDKKVLLGTERNIRLSLERYFNKSSRVERDYNSVVDAVESSKYAYFRYATFFGMYIFMFNFTGDGAHSPTAEAAAAMITDGGSGGSGGMLALEDRKRRKKRRKQKVKPTSGGTTSGGGGGGTSSVILLPDAPSSSPSSSSVILLPDAPTTSPTKPPVPPKPSRLTAPTAATPGPKPSRPPPPTRPPPGLLAIEDAQQPGAATSTALVPYSPPPKRSSQPGGSTALVPYQKPQKPQRPPKPTRPRPQLAIANMPEKGGEWIPRELTLGPGEYKRLSQIFLTVLHLMYRGPQNRNRFGAAATQGDISPGILRKHVVDFYNYVMLKTQNGWITTKFVIKLAAKLNSHLEQFYFFNDPRNEKAMRGGRAPSQYLLFGLHFIDAIDTRKEYQELVVAKAMEPNLGIRGKVAVLGVIQLAVNKFAIDTPFETIFAAGNTTKVPNIAWFPLLNLPQFNILPPENAEVVKVRLHLEGKTAFGRNRNQFGALFDPFRRLLGRPVKNPMKAQGQLPIVPSINRQAADPSSFTPITRTQIRDAFPINLITWEKAHANKTKIFEELAKIEARYNTYTSQLTGRIPTTYLSIQQKLRTSVRKKMQTIRTAYMNYENRPSVSTTIVPANPNDPKAVQKAKEAREKAEKAAQDKVVNAINAFQREVQKQVRTSLKIMLLYLQPSRMRTIIRGRYNPDFLVFLNQLRLYFAGSPASQADEIPDALNEPVSIQNEIIPAIRDAPTGAPLLLANFGNPQMTTAMVPATPVTDLEQIQPENIADENISRLAINNKLVLMKHFSQPGSSNVDRDLTYTMFETFKNTYEALYQSRPNSAVPLHEPITLLMSTNQVFVLAAYDLYILFQGIRRITALNIHRINYDRATKLAKQKQLEINAAIRNRELVCNQEIERIRNNAATDMTLRQIGTETNENTELGRIYRETRDMKYVLGYPAAILTSGKLFGRFGPYYKSLLPKDTSILKRFGGHSNKTARYGLGYLLHALEYAKAKTNFVALMNDQHYTNHKAQLTYINTQKASDPNFCLIGSFCANGVTTSDTNVVLCLPTIETVASKVSEMFNHTTNAVIDIESNTTMVKFEQQAIDDLSQQLARLHGHCDSNWQRMTNIPLIQDGVNKDQMIQQLGIAYNQNNSKNIELEGYFVVTHIIQTDGAIFASQRADIENEIKREEAVFVATKQFSQYNSLAFPTVFYRHATDYRNDKPPAIHSILQMKYVPKREYVPLMTFIRQNYHDANALSFRHAYKSICPAEIQPTDTDTLLYMVDLFKPLNDLYPVDVLDFYQRFFQTSLFRFHLEFIFTTRPLNECLYNIFQALQLLYTTGIDQGQFFIHTNLMGHNTYIRKTTEMHALNPVGRCTSDLIAEFERCQAELRVIVDAKVKEENSSVFDKNQEEREAKAKENMTRVEREHLDLINATNKEAFKYEKIDPRIPVKSLPEKIKAFLENNQSGNQSVRYADWDLVFTHYGTPNRDTPENSSVLDYFQRELLSEVTVEGFAFFHDVFCENIFTELIQHSQTQVLLGIVLGIYKKFLLAKFKQFLDTPKEFNRYTPEFLRFQA